MEKIEAVTINAFRQLYEKHGIATVVADGKILRFTAEDKDV